MGEENKQMFEKSWVRRAWLIATICIVTGIFLAATKSKINGTMVNIMDYFVITKATAGILSSIVAGVGLVIALPAGAIMTKFGPIKMGVIAITSAIVGNFLGAIEGSWELLIVARFIESLGIGLIALVVPAIITAWFPMEKRGAPMGIWSCFSAVGSTLALQTAKVVVPEFGWRSLWVVLGIALVVMLVLFLLFVKMPDRLVNAAEKDVAKVKAKLSKNNANAAEKDGGAAKLDVQATKDTDKPKEGTIVKALLSPSTWFLTIAFGVFTFMCAAAFAFTPTYLQRGLGFDNATALNYGSIQTGTMIVCGIIMGILLNKLNKHRPAILLVSEICMAMILSFLYSYGSEMAVAYMFLSGAVLSMVPATVWTIAPETSPNPQSVGTTMGIIVVGQSIGGMFGPVVVGSLAAEYWGNAIGVLGILGAIGVACAICCFFLLKKGERKQAA